MTNYSGPKRKTSPATDTGQAKTTKNNVSSQCLAHGSAQKAHFVIKSLNIVVFDRIGVNVEKV